MKQRLTYREFVDWIAYYKLNPFGDDWRQTAILGNLISIQAANHRLKEPVKQSDLIPYHKDQRKTRLLRLKHELDRRRKG